MFPKPANYTPPAISAEDAAALAEGIAAALADITRPKARPKARPKPPLADMTDAEFAHQATRK